MQIHLLKTRLVNSYIVEYPDQLFVIDVAAGCHDHVAAFITGKLGRALDEIKLIVCTHDDPDHLGGLRALAASCGASICIPYASKSLHRKVLNDPQAFFFRFATAFRESLRARTWDMYSNPERSNKTRAEIESLQQSTNLNLPKKKFSQDRIKDNEALPMFDDWKLLHTPGHSWDSCCYYHESTETLISGDTLLGSRKRGHLIPPAILANPRHLKRSYHKLSKLKIRRVFPGHGSMIEGNNLVHRRL